MYSSSSSRSASPVVTQTIAHTIQGDAVSFEVPVTFDVSGEVFVMLQPILDVFPETAALSRRDNIQLPFLTNSHGVLLVPLRISYYPDETLYIVPSSAVREVPSWVETPPHASTALYQTWQDLPAHPLPSTNPFRRDIEDLRAQQNSSRFTPDTDESGLTELAILASALGINDWPSEPSFDFNAQSLAGGGGVPASTRDTTSFFDTPPAAQARPDITILEQTETFSPLSKIGAALISQPMPLSELLISRLFIILPDPKPRQWSENGDTTPRPYRLYFLCDCGPGTTFPRLGGTRTTTQGYTAGSIDIHNCIHIADQTGYEVLNFDQFSEQFGLYTLLVLQLFQQGIDTTTKRGCIEKSKISIPPLSQTHYTDVLQPFTWDIKERVSTAIETLKRTTNWDEFQQIEHPPEIDLRRLWECVEGLQVGGETQVEGMRRMFVHDGTFRWICKDHYESTFEFLQDDRDRLIYMCKQLLEDESDNDPSDQLGAANEGDDAAFLASGQAVEFDDRKKHLRLSGAFTVDKIKDLEKIISNDYTVQQITLASPLSSTELLVAITDMISKSKNVQWNMLFIPEQPIIANASIAVAAAAPATTASITPSPALPPPYSRTGHAPYAGPHGLSPTSRSRPRSLSALTKEQYTNGRLHPICDLFLLGQIQSLQIPDLDRGLFDNLDPSPGDFPYLRKLHIWGSDASGETASVPGKDSVLDKTWNFAGLGALVKSFSNLTELHITGIHLGKNTSNGLDKCQKTSLTSPSRASAEPPQLLEIAQCLLYLPKLSVLNLSSCGLLKENCEVLARSLGFLNNRITHLDIHDNWIEDEGLAELLWAIGKRLYSLDARNTGFGNASAFALASMLQHHQDEIQHNRSSGLEGRMAIYRILRLEETHHPHQRIWPSDGIHPFGSQIPNLDEGGRQNLIRVLELLEPKELCLRFNLGFEDEDFASAFSGMKNLECLERLQVANSNFGPKALAAMLRILRATSCGIRELEIHSTLLSEKEQQDALFQIQEI